MHGPNENRDRQHAVVRILQRLGTLAATAFLGVLLTATLVRNSPGFDADERLLDARLDDASRAAIRGTCGQPRRPGLLQALPGRDAARRFRNFAFVEPSHL